MHRRRQGRNTETRREQRLRSRSRSRSRERVRESERKRAKRQRAQRRKTSEHHQAPLPSPDPAISTLPCPVTLCSPLLSSDKTESRHRARPRAGIPSAFSARELGLVRPGARLSYVAPFPPLNFALRGLALAALLFRLSMPLCSLSLFLSFSPSFSSYPSFSSPPSLRATPGLRTLLAEGSKRKTDEMQRGTCMTEEEKGSERKKEKKEMFESRLR